MSTSRALAERVPAGGEAHGAAGPPRCRFCGEALGETFADLGVTPIANNILTAAGLRAPEPFYPLHAYVCGGCFLVQIEQAQTPRELFGDDYPYFSSYSESWLDHARRYAAEAVERFGLGPASQVVEVASNDGYLLRFFHERGIPVLGIEPAANVARAAMAIGIPTRVRFFGPEAARDLVVEGRQADLLIGNNVLAHVPDISGFVAGLAMLLKPQGVLTMEFPHVLQLMRRNAFDTIYHEHFSYLSLLAVERIFAAHGLGLFDVEELPTHGGSLRIHAQRREGRRPRAPGLQALRDVEREAGLHEPSAYRGFSEQVKAIKRDLLAFLIEARRQGKRIAGYGAAAKGNTLLNYCGIRTDFIDYVVDINPHKQGLYLPGTRIPTHHPDHVRATRPDYLLILPWNIRDEIIGQMNHIRDWGGAFVVAIPKLEVIR